jgi:hypothetical protein
MKDEESIICHLLISDSVIACLIVLIALHFDNTVLSCSYFLLCTGISRLEMEKLMYLFYGTQKRTRQNRKKSIGTTIFMFSPTVTTTDEE